MYEIFFEKTKGTINKTSVYAEAAVQRVLQKSCYEKIWKIHKKTYVPEKQDSSASVFLWSLQNL